MCSLLYLTCSSAFLKMLSPSGADMKKNGDSAKALCTLRIFTNLYITAFIKLNQPLSHHIFNIISSGVVNTLYVCILCLVKGTGFFLSEERAQLLPSDNTLAQDVCSIIFAHADVVLFTQNSDVCKVDVLWRYRSEQVVPAFDETCFHCCLLQWEIRCFWYWSSVEQQLSL